MVTQHINLKTMLLRFWMKWVPQTPACSLHFHCCYTFFLKEPPKTLHQNFELYRAKIGKLSMKLLSAFR
jgi:hypothetical protein